MGLLPVMEMAAPVLSVHPVVKGATVSYGCLYTAPKDIRAAVVGAGYADGYPRSLSMRGSVLINYKRHDNKIIKVLITWHFHTC